LENQLPIKLASFCFHFRSSGRKNQGLCLSVLQDDPGLFNKFVRDKAAALQILFVHIHGMDLAVTVGGIVVDPPVGIAAGTVNGDLIHIRGKFYTAPLHFHGFEDVEKLIDAFVFGIL
jgi:hypothetical protein